MPLRSIILKIHLFVGLFAALFLVILGLRSMFYTGSASGGKG